MRNIKFTILAIFILSLSLNAKEFTQEETNIDNTVWCLYSSNKPVYIMYFNYGYYVILRANIYGDFKIPKTKIRYNQSFNKDALHIESMLLPKPPALILNNKKDKLRRTWPLNQGEEIFIKISEEQANEIIKSFNLKSLDFNNIKEAQRAFD